MKRHPARWGLLALACLLVAACHDRRDPVRPTVDLSASTASLSQAVA